MQDNPQRADASEINELNEWLKSLLNQEKPADPLTVCNVHRRLARLHQDAAEAVFSEPTDVETPPSS